MSFMLTLGDGTTSISPANENGDEAGGAFVLGMIFNQKKQAPGEKTNLKGHTPDFCIKFTNPESVNVVIRALEKIREALLVRDFKDCSDEMVAAIEEVQQGPI
jgi:hypothetical protein